jgi:hypothetical protein
MALLLPGATNGNPMPCGTLSARDDVDPNVLQRRRCLGLLSSSALYTVLYVGAYFGWGPTYYCSKTTVSF